MKNHEKSSLFRKNRHFSKKRPFFEKTGKNGRFPDSLRAKRAIKGEKRTKTPKKRTFGPENELAIFEKKKKSSTTP